MYNDNEVEPNDQWFFDRPDFFPWNIMNLDKPCYAPLYSYLCKIAAKYEKNINYKIILSGNPTFKQIEKHAVSLHVNEQNKIINAIYNFVINSENYEKNVDYNVVLFLKEFEPFRKDFFNRLLELWKSGRIILKGDQLRKKVFLKWDIYENY